LKQAYGLLSLKKKHMGYYIKLITQKKIEKYKIQNLAGKSGYWVGLNEILSIFLGSHHTTASIIGTQVLDFIG